MDSKPNRKNKSHFFSLISYFSAASTEKSREQKIAEEARLEDEEQAEKMRRNAERNAKHRDMWQSTRRDLVLLRIKSKW